MFADAGGPLISAAGDDPRRRRDHPSRPPSTGAATSARRRINHLRPRRRQCEGFFPKCLPKTADLRNMRVLGSDVAATKHVAE
jgi:hypothetical protein